MEPFSDNLLLSRTSLDLSQDGNYPSLLEDMLSEINIRQPISKLTSLENSRLFLQVMMAVLSACKSITLKEQVVSEWECTILMKVLKDLPTAALNLL